MSYTVSVLRSLVRASLPAGETAAAQLAGKIQSWERSGGVEVGPSFRGEGLEAELQRGKGGCRELCKQAKKLSRTIMDNHITGNSVQ